MSKFDNYTVAEKDLPPLAWGAMDQLKQCPHKYLRTKIVKDVKEDFSGEALVWGNEVHKALENYLAHGESLPARFSQYADYAKKLTNLPGIKLIELKLASTRDFQPRRFFDNTCTYRGVIDYLAIDGNKAYMVDHKTGKVKPSDQLALCALLVFANHPEVDTIKAAFTWLQFDTYTKETYLRDDAEDIEEQKFAPIIKTRKQLAKKGLWPKKPSGLCAYCPVTDCEHHP